MIQLTLILIDPDDADFWEKKEPVQLSVGIVNDQFKNIREVGTLKVPFDLFKKLHDLSYNTDEDVDFYEGHQYLFDHFNNIVWNK